ncbi:AMP-binding protein [Methyloprofundus sp.]|uniref:AMP-binding protein n=1 Tax=Methyloprofundus sp. TaxID=2020875 RepID=UPI003D1006C6
MIIKSPSPAIEIPNISWPEYFLARIEPYHKEIALIDGDSGRQINYDELKKNIRSVAAALQQKGYKKGDVFAIYAPNIIEYIYVFQSVMLIGGVITTANPLYTAGELEHQLQHSKAICLLTTSDLLEKVGPMLKATLVKDIFVFNHGDAANSFDLLMQDNNATELQSVSIDPLNDIAILPYSSGTTGLPKGVMLREMERNNHPNEVSLCLNNL